MKSKSYKFGTAAPAALLILSCSASWADVLPDNVLIGTFGDGMIFSDPAEGVVEPGIKAVTFTSTRIPDGSGGFTYVDPFQQIVTDFSGLTSRGNVTNCLMASNPDVFCDSESGSGKRIKTYITGPAPFDMRLQTTPSMVSPTVDYFTFGKVSNFTGARMTGFSLQLLDSNGVLMDAADPNNAVLFNLAATQIGLGSGLPDGLFGDGGNEGEIGFFSANKATLDLTASVNELAFGALRNTEYVANFGTAFLDNSMVPNGLFWDDNNDPTDESSLVAWNNIAAGGWTYGTLDTAANLNSRLTELASTLGVAVADLGYVDGGLVPADIVALAQANGLFAVDAVEDLRNANLNYTMTVGTVDGGEFTLRLVPIFAPIVASAQDTYQFKLAGNLDAAANVPYWDLGNAAAYQAAIVGMLALSPADRSTALNSIGFSFAPAFSSLGFEAARNQIATILDYSVPWERTGGDADVISSQGVAQPWVMGDGLYGLFSIGGSRSSYDPTTGSVGYDVDMASFSLGLEKRLSDSNTSIGVIVGGTTGSADANQGLGEIDTDGYSLAAFARNQFGEGGLFQALIGYQDLSYDSTRTVMGQTARGDTDGSQFFAALKVDYLKDFGSFKFGPTASLEYYDVSTDAFTETGAGIWNLNVAKQSGDTLMASVGVRGEYQIQSVSSDTLLTGSLEYTNASGDDLVIQSGLVGLPGISYTVDGLSENLVSLNLGLESVVSARGSRKVVLQSGYRGAFGSDYESHGLQIGLNFTF
ncbi:choice-of-anchor F family protein [Roseovarius arcticus]|uniref:choice-of-anchor F family protein n=1 Tax=Roseovarius arcticus TaxID=2547404 RepID=UPI001BB12A19|nr:choice-of-anchor F family protein [Roseovarius arcticus]